MQLCLVFGAIFLAVAAMLGVFAHHRDLVIWSTWLGVVLLLSSGFCWFQSMEWNRDAEREKSASPTKRPRIVIVDTELIIPEDEGPWRVTFTLVNSGDEDAIVTMKDQTAAYIVTPEQTAFKYEHKPALDFPVSALTGTGSHAEMRFNMLGSEERRESLKSGKARLFVFARAEYRDSAGNLYPLPFARMYDTNLSDKLVFCPNNITFE